MKFRTDVCACVCVSQHGGLTMGQWGEGSGGMWSSGSMEAKGSSGGMSVWEEALKNQNSLRNMGMKNSRSSPSLRYQGEGRRGRSFGGCMCATK